MPGPVHRLIETDEMPIGPISTHARKDQNVRKGHLHTLHVGWATRPLAVCQAVLLATLRPDPAYGNCPEAFCRQAQTILKTFGVLRQRTYTTRKEEGLQ